MRFHLHPDPVRLFDILSTGLETGQWAEFAIAVAWARESAVGSLTPVLRQFLGAGVDSESLLELGYRGPPRRRLKLCWILRRLETQQLSSTSPQLRVPVRD